MGTASLEPSLVFTTRMEQVTQSPAQDPLQEPALVQTVSAQPHQVSAPFSASFHHMHPSRASYKALSFLRSLTAPIIGRGQSVIPRPQGPKWPRCSRLPSPSCSLCSSHGAFAHPSPSAGHTLPSLLGEQGRFLHLHTLSTSQGSSNTHPTNEYTSE